MCFLCTDYVISPDPRKRSNREYFIFAKIVDKRGRVLSSGYNSYVKTHPAHLKFSLRAGRVGAMFLHAETMAILRLRPQQRERAYAIYVYRFRHDGSPAMAKPCETCQMMLSTLPNLKKIFYTSENNPLDCTYEEYLDMWNGVESWQ